MVLSCSKKLPALLKGIISKHYGDFYCLNCLHSFATRNKCESHKKVCENKDLVNVVISSEDTEMLEFNQYQKFDKVSFITYADLECLIKKKDQFKNNPENSFKTKAGKHISSGFSMSTMYKEVNIAWKSFVNP